MLTQEFMTAIAAERARQVAEAQDRRRAREAQRRTGSPRSGPSENTPRRRPPLSLLAKPFRTASAS